MPPPGGGLTLVQLLGLLDPADLAASGAGSAASLHQLTEAMNLAYRDRNTWLGDPASMASPPPDLLDPAYLDQLRQSIDPRRHRPAAAIAAPPPPRRESMNTTHLSVADRHGGLVALTTTLNFAYGNGVTVPGAGFLLNNEMDDFSAAPGRPNSFGLVQGEANTITPGRRPLSSMAPTLVFRPDGTPWLATGSPGGSRIITTVAQVLMQRILWGANLATALAAPRHPLAAGGDGPSPPAQRGDGGGQQCRGTGAVGQRQSRGGGSAPGPHAAGGGVTALRSSCRLQPRPAVVGCTSCPCLFWRSRCRRRRLQPIAASPPKNGIGAGTGS
jgi:gamma-glutamyltranspeptidase